MKPFICFLLFFATLPLVSQETRPNIIWIMCEDISPYIGTYGDPLAKTPNIDRLAREGVKYTKAYTTAGVCSPSRSSIITGMYPTSIGTQHMRTKAIDPKYMGAGVPNYSAVIPPYVKAFPEYLRENGYYTTNNEKEDYQFDVPVTVWDESSPAATYLNRLDNQPFFSIFNLFITHESQIFTMPDSLVVEPSRIELPAYYQDTETVRKDFANLYTRIAMMDANVGEIIQELKDNGLYENSYIFFFSDHGGNLPWMKREILERGTHIPFIVKYPKGQHAGEVVTDLVSSVDFAPAVLSLAGIRPPEYLQGVAFLGKYASTTKRRYVFAGRDRMDEKYDRVRAVRDDRYRYVYNYMSNKPRYQDLSYRLGIPYMCEILRMKEHDEITNPYLAAWFEVPKPIEELYDVENDPDEIHNLANDPKYTPKLKELRDQFQKWTKEVGDMSSIPEREMVVANWWGGKDKAPVTAKPEITTGTTGVKISCNTDGASIGYRIVKDGIREPALKHTIKSWDSNTIFNRVKKGDTLEAAPTWNVYDGGIIPLEKGDKLIVNAMRIGYGPTTLEYAK